ETAVRALTPADGGYRFQRDLTAEDGELFATTHHPFRTEAQVGLLCLAIVIGCTSAVLALCERRGDHDYDGRGPATGSGRLQAHTHVVAQRQRDDALAFD